MAGHDTGPGQYLEDKAENREGRESRWLIWGQVMWSWSAVWDRRLRFEVRIVATVAYIVSSVSFPVELSNVPLWKRFLL